MFHDRANDAEGRSRSPEAVRAAFIMRRMGFPDAEQGPFVTELRALTLRQVGEGMTDRSEGSWSPEAQDFDTGEWKISHEERARHFLAVEWELANGHYQRVECFDPPIYWQTDVRTMRRRLIVRWRRIPAWLGDRARGMAMRYRILRDNAAGLQNPYVR